jgi:hypothetical protein
LAKAEEEALRPGAFDPHRMKEGIWHAFKEGRVSLDCRENGQARVLAFLPPGTHVPWAVWGRIFKWFGPSPTGEPWLIVWYASEKQREFPEEGHELAAEHVNGGYTYRCSTRGIFIYRIEEATRVLIHEMFHASCLDSHVESLPHREAYTETWAELLLIAVLAQGSTARALTLWKKQAQWIADTNKRASSKHGSHDASDYAWRYLNGREEVFRQLGIQLPSPSKNLSSMALTTRFTHPDLEVKG